MDQKSAFKPLGNIPELKGTFYVQEPMKSLGPIEELSPGDSLTLIPSNENGSIVRVKSKDKTYTMDKTVLETAFRGGYLSSLRPRE